MFKIQKSCGLEYFEYEDMNVYIMKYDNRFCYTDGYSIYVNKMFMDLSNTNLQQFILCHELGHIHHGHTTSSNIRFKLYKFKRKIYSKIGLVVKEEIEADLYAASKIGKENAIKALKDSKTILKSKEFNIRKVMVKILG